jgi:hypothetical protein
MLYKRNGYCLKFHDFSNMLDIPQTVTLIRKATHGLGTDEKMLISTLANFPIEELPSLEAHYKANYGASLDKTLEKECGGKFG